MLKLFDLGRWVAMFAKNWINPFATLFFNFYYLPLSKALKLPVWVYGKPKFLGLKGSVVIDAENIWAGMIRLNQTKHTPYPSIPFEWVNDGGSVVFHGVASMDCGARIHVFGGGTLDIGNGVRMTGATIGCQDKVMLGDNVWVGNGSIIYDTDFHYFLNKDTGTVSKSFRPVIIENDVSIFTQCYIAKGVKIPHHCVVAARTVLMAKPYKCKPYSLIGGNPPEIVATEFEHLRLDARGEEKMSNLFKNGEQVVKWDL